MIRSGDWQWQIYKGNKALQLAIGWITKIYPGWLNAHWYQTALGNRMYLGSEWHQQVDRECSKASNKNLPHPMLGNIPTLFSLLFFFTKSTFLSTSGKDLQGKKTMLRSEMLINIRCKHQLLCLDRSGSQVRLFTSPQGPLETPTLQSSLGRPAK